MVDTTVNRGDCYITDGTISQSGNTTTITTTEDQIVVQIIPTTKIDYIYDNNIVTIPIPNSRAKRSNLPLNRIIDLKRIKETLTIQGFLADETSSSAEKKRDDLLTLAKHRGELTVVFGHKYSTNDYQTLWKKPVNSGSEERGCFIMKMSFTSTTGKIGLNIGGVSTTRADGSVVYTEEPAERNIGFNMTLIRGMDM